MRLSMILIFNLSSKLFLSIFFEFLPVEDIKWSGISLRKANLAMRRDNTMMSTNTPNPTPTPIPIAADDDDDSEFVEVA